MCCLTPVIPDIRSAYGSVEERSRTRRTSRGRGHDAPQVGLRIPDHQTSMHESWLYRHSARDQD